MNIGFLFKLKIFDITISYLLKTSQNSRDCARFGIKIENVIILTAFESPRQVLRFYRSGVWHLMWYSIIYDYIDVI